jgi:hypothetical protein|tara:strand:- start:269 stop:472 length:204 start_codon:yes stop_codon:yes gene_type:complete
MKTEPAERAPPTVTYDNNVNFGSPAPKKDISDAYFDVSYFFILIYYYRECVMQNKEWPNKESKTNLL